MPTHDLAGLEAALALTHPLEEILVGLDTYRTAQASHLRPKEREGLEATIRSLVLTLQTIMDRPAQANHDPHWKPTKAETPAFVCRKCGSDDVWYRDCSCTDFDDTEYHCRGCGRRWWCEGADA
jgi:DNA-directed RNA polymerase subunit M/transcription elongation factor TFIIS